MDMRFPSYEELPELYLTGNEADGVPLEDQYSKIFPRDKLGNELDMSELAPTFLKVPVVELRGCLMKRGSKLPAYRRFKIGTEEMLHDFRKLKRASSGDCKVGLEYCLDVPIFSVKNEEEARSVESDVLKTEICIVRGLPEAVGMDLRKYDSEVILQRAPARTNIEVRKQVPQPRCSNLIRRTKTPTWEAEAERYFVNLRGYVEYQQRQMNHEAKKPVWGDHNVPTFVKEGLIFGTNLDLDDPAIWSDQIKEVAKLPRWAAVASKEFNFLSHYGDVVQGVNAIQMYLKVRQSRTPAHQENLNFCSVNINIGPGNTEWFSVDYGYWEIVKNMCEKRGINFASSAWWPDILELQEAGVPVRRFTQKPGDLVYVNRGCIHWVQAESACNNIAWNVGPLSSEQFRATLVRYEENFKLSFQSIVPIRRLVWDFVLNFEDINKLELQLRKDLAYVCGLILVEELMLEEDIKKHHILHLLEDDKKIVSKEDQYEVLQYQYERFSLEENLAVLRYCGKCEAEILSFVFISLDPSIEPTLSFDNVVFCFSCVKAVPEAKLKARHNFAFLYQPSSENTAFYDKFEKLRQGILIEEYYHRNPHSPKEVQHAAKEPSAEREVPIKKRRTEGKVTVLKKALLSK